MTDPSASSPQRMLLLAFVVPLLVYTLGTALEPDPAASTAVPASGESADLPLLDTAAEADETPAPQPPVVPYPLVFTGKVVLTALCVAWFWPVYLREFPLKASWLAVVVGVLGVVVWVGLWHLRLELHLVTWLGGPNSSAVEWLGLGERPAYNPIEQAATDPWAYAFLAVRFVGLVVLVPIVEELFLRAFFMRYVMHDNWWHIPFGEVNAVAIAAGLALPVLYHPEKLSALVWFAMVTWLMIRTRNFWDCVIAHAVTNLLLGVYVVATGTWALW